MTHILSLRDPLAAYGTIMGLPHNEPIPPFAAKPLIHMQTAAHLGLPADPDPHSFQRALSGPSRIEALAGHRFGDFIGPFEDNLGRLLGTLSTPHGDRDLYFLGTTGNTRQITLAACLQELIGSAALNGQGIPSTRTLALFSDRLHRPNQPAAIIRVANSHLRFGHFEYLFHTQQHSSLRQLMDDCIARLLPDQAGLDTCYEQFFAYVVQRTAHMIGAWQSCGFTHGLMHTDNMSICGETFCFSEHSFMTHYQPTQLSNPVDHLGRYAFHMQTSIAYWNLQMLSKVFTTLVPLPVLSDHLETFDDQVSTSFTELMTNKFGFSVSDDSTQKVMRDAFELMTTLQLDYHCFFYRLSQVDSAQGEEAFLTMPSVKETWVTEPRHRDEVLALLETWLSQYKKVIAGTSRAYKVMREHNPMYVPRPDWVGRCIEKPEQLPQLLSILDKPYQIDESMSAWHVAAPYRATHSQSK